jgi:hypothetical protein
MRLLQPPPLFLLAASLVLPGRLGAQDAVLSMSLDRTLASGGESVNGLVRRPSTTGDVIVKLESSPTGLVKLSATEFRIAAGKTTGSFQVLIVPSQIKSSVTIKAIVQPVGSTAPGVAVSQSISIVPALLKSLSLSGPSMVGTHGAKVDATVELNAPAPTGGIELYITGLGDISGASPQTGRLNLRLPANPRVAAGSRTVTFAIRYDDIYELTNSGESPVSSFMARVFFNQANRKLRLTMALDPAAKTTQTGFLLQTQFDVGQFRPATFTLQSASLVGGTETLATFTMNTPPGPGERVALSPESVTTAWAVPVGSSCQSITSVREMDLVQNQTTHTLKVCSSPTTTTKTQVLSITARGGTATAMVTVRP